MYHVYINMYIYIYICIASGRIGTAQRELARPTRRDDTNTSRCVDNIIKFIGQD